MTKKPHFKPVFCRFFTKKAFVGPFCDFLKPFHPLTRDTMATAACATLKSRLAAFFARYLTGQPYQHHCL